MKFRLIILMIFLLSFSDSFLFAQDDDGDEIKMTQPEWHLKRDQYAVSAITLLSKLEKLNAQIDSLKTVNIETDSILTNSEDNLYSLVGATRQQVAEFRNNFTALETKLKNNNSTPGELRNDLDEFSAGKIRCLPEFADRYAFLRKKIASLDEGKHDADYFYNEQNYEVVNGDCLWNIANVKYGNPLYWPLIWDANKRGVVNTDRVDYFFEKRISNPNLIYPGQLLKIPSLNDKKNNDLNPQNSK